MRVRKPKRRVYNKLPPYFASDYIKALRSLSRKHKDDDAGEVKKALHLLDNMSQESYIAKRGELWIPVPDARTGYYPIMEKIPYAMVRRATRKNTSGAERARSWGVVASSVEPFVPLFARRPGSLDEAQRRRLLSHVMVSLPLVKGRYPALLGKRVPGAEGSDIVKSRSLIPMYPGQRTQVMAPEDWEKGFTMRKFSLLYKKRKKLKTSSKLMLGGVALSVGGLAALRSKRWRHTAGPTLVNVIQRQRHMQKARELTAFLKKRGFIYAAGVHRVIPTVLGRRRFTAKQVLAAAWKRAKQKHPIGLKRGLVTVAPLAGLAAGMGLAQAGVMRRGLEEQQRKGKIEKRPWKKGERRKFVAGGLGASVVGMGLLKLARRAKHPMLRALLPAYGGMLVGGGSITAAQSLLTRKRWAKVEKKKKFSLADDLTRASKRLAKPHVRLPKLSPPKVNLEDLKKQLKVKVTLEPEQEQRDYSVLGELAKRLRSISHKRKVLKIRAAVKPRPTGIVRGGGLWTPPPVVPVAPTLTHVPLSPRRVESLRKIGVSRWTIAGLQERPVSGTRHLMPLPVVSQLTAPIARRVGAKGVTLRGFTTEELMAKPGILGAAALRTKQMKTLTPEQVAKLRATGLHPLPARKIIAHEIAHLTTAGGVATTAGAPEGPIHKAARRRVEKIMRQTGVMQTLRREGYAMTMADRMCYEDGFREWLKKAKLKTTRTWRRAKRWVKGEVVPVLARGATLGVAELAQTEIGGAPMTVDMLPVTGVGLKQSLQPYPNVQLRGIVQSLQQRLVAEADPVLRKGLEKGISEIATEIAVRRAMI